MKLTMKWGGKVRNRKTFKPEPKIRWDLLGLADPSKEKIPMPIDEVRRQVLMMSSPGFDQDSATRLDALPQKNARALTSVKPGPKPRRVASK
ncbi:MAG: hypothetical protein KC592_00540 [Nitrospira sp.]|nr:hypothetical protein [Nitrospira sp.]HBP87503.1 hypothetical protein [Nitrospiraceae bacterium]HNP29458.1 hypothetical protein [Nitrospirales bacterium]